MSQHNDRLGQVLNLLAAVAQQVAKNPLFHVEKIGGAAGKSALIQAFQSFGMAAHHAADGVFRGMTLFSNQSFDLAGQRRVFDHASAAAAANAS